MFNSLLYLGLCVTSFAFFPGADLRELKMTMAIVFALSLGMAEIFSNGLKPGKNIWVYILLAYIPISILIAPSPDINLVGINVMGFWAYKPLIKILIFALLFMAISSHEFSQKDIRTILSVMLWCGVLTSLYEMTQMFWCDQFFVVCADGNWGRIAGFIGNPTLTAPFVAMLVPIALYLRKYVCVSVLIAGAIIPDSQMAWIALIIGILVYFALKGPKWFVSLSFILFLLISAYFMVLISGRWEHIHNHSLRSIFEDHERFIQWRQIFKDWTGPLNQKAGVMNNYSLTGRGLGSFQFVYHIQNINIGSPNRFHQAHNDYLEFAYGTGFIGISLWLCAIFHMIKRNVSMQFVFTLGESRYSRALLSSLFIIGISAFGTFVFQIGTMAFFSVVLAGLLHNDSLITKESI